jgi:hypothetical protein
MKQKVVVVKPTKPTSISQALIMASKNTELVEEQGMYLEQETEFDGQNDKESNIYKVCAVGGLFVTVASHNAIQKQLDDGEDPVLMIRTICREIKGACESVPWKIWLKYHSEDYGGTTKEETKKFESNYNKRKTNWVNLAEHMFESLDMTFVEIAKEFKKHGK